jgi:predicted Zn-dependent protease
MLRRLALVLAFVALVATTAAADEVVLKNGGLIRGRVVSEDEREVVVQTDAGPVKIPRAKVREVVRSQVPPPPTPGPTEPAQAGDDAAARVDAEAAARGTVLLFGYDDCDRELLDEIARGVRRSLALRVEVLAARPRPDEAQLVQNREQGILALAASVGEPIDAPPDELERRLRTSLERDPRPMARQALKTLDDMIAPKLNARVLGSQSAMVAKDRLAAPGVIAVLGVTGRDLSLPDMNFVFGRVYKTEKAGAMSYYRFLDTDRRETLRRAVSEAVFLLAWALGVERCPTPTCAGASTNGVAQHDRKSAELCGTCREKVDAALAKRR